MLLKNIHAKKIIDSRNQPTIELTINGQKASSPSGKSTGKFETPPYHKSLNWNIRFLNSLKPNIEINSFHDLKKLESLIKKKAKLKDVKKFGANALFALESATLKALAKSHKKQLFQIINPHAKKLPTPVGNAIGGGLHSHNENHPIFQEFLIIPNGKNFKEKVDILNQTHKKLKSTIKAKNKNDEGAWQTNLNNEQVLQVLKQFKNISMGIDAAANSFHNNKEYNYKNKSLNRIAQIHYINLLINQFNIFYFEDPLIETDFKGFSQIKHSSLHLVVGDDLTATQLSRVKRAIKSKAINSMIIKPNQNGSLLELAEIFQLCKKHNIKTIISHRSGETLDDALADYAVGFQADYIKCGISTKWRQVKLKRLINIEKQISK